MYEDEIEQGPLCSSLLQLLSTPLEYPFTDYAKAKAAPKSLIFSNMIVENPIVVKC